MAVGESADRTSITAQLNPAPPTLAQNTSSAGLPSSP
jgi:hypothetical protein